MEKEIEVSRELIARCGLYCGACRKLLVGKCPGCRKNQKASWCKIRSCSASQGYHTCAECPMNVKQCKTYSNLIGKIFGLLFNSDRAACIDRIRMVGGDEFARDMAAKRQQSLKGK